MPPVREPGDISDLDQQPGGAGWADPLQAHQRGPGRLERRDQFPVGGLLALAGALQVRDQLRGDPAAGLPGPVPRPDPAQQDLAWAADSAFFAPPGIRSASSWQIIRM